MSRLFSTRATSRCSPFLQGSFHAPHMELPRSSNLSPLGRSSKFDCVGTRSYQEKHPNHAPVQRKPTTHRFVWGVAFDHTKSGGIVVNEVKNFSSDTSRQLFAPIDSGSINWDEVNLGDQLIRIALFSQRTDHMLSDGLTASFSHTSCSVDHDSSNSRLNAIAHENDWWFCGRENGCARFGCNEGRTPAPETCFQWFSNFNNFLNAKELRRHFVRRAGTTQTQVFHRFAQRA